MCSRLGDIAGKANFSMQILIPSRPVALLDEIFLRSCSTIFLVTGGITNRDGDVLIDLLFENSLWNLSLRRGISELIVGAFEFCPEGRQFEQVNFQKFKCPGGLPWGWMLRLRFDWYISSVNWPCCLRMPVVSWHCKHYITNITLQNHTSAYLSI